MNEDRLSRLEEVLRLDGEWEQQRRGLLYWTGEEPKAADAPVKAVLAFVFSGFLFFVGAVLGGPVGPLVFAFAAFALVGMLGGVVFSQNKWERFREARDAYLQ